MNYKNLSWFVILFSILIDFANSFKFAINSINPRSNLIFMKTLDQSRTDYNFIIASGIIANEPVEFNLGHGKIVRSFTVRKNNEITIDFRNATYYYSVRFSQSCRF